MPVWGAQYSGVEEMKVAVMGCVVNGPGESKHSNIGISLPGTFEEPVAPVYVDGKLKCTLRGDHIVEEFLVILNDYVDRTYAAKAPRSGGRLTKASSEPLNRGNRSSVSALAAAHGIVRNPASPPFGGLLNPKARGRPSCQPAAISFAISQVRR